MNRKRSDPDGLPYRVYERYCIRTYSIGYKQPDGTWVFRLKCPVGDKAKVAALRRDAIERAMKLRDGPPPEDTIAAWIDDWFRHQESLPLTSEDRRAESTLTENRREAAMLKKAFGHMRGADLERPDGYAYLDACRKTERPAKGNKEISLMRTILEFHVRRGRLKVNPFDGIEKIKTTVESRLVTDEEMALAVEMGRKLGGAKLITALALKTAWLCLKPRAINFAPDVR